MPSIFRPNIILHIEDEPDWRRTVYGFLSDSDKIVKLGDGSGLVYVESTIEEELENGAVASEITRL